MTSLLARIADVARSQNAARVAAVDLKAGALLPITPAHLREHFVQAAAGTVAEGAEVRVRLTDELTGLELESVEIES